MSSAFYAGNMTYDSGFVNKRALPDLSLSMYAQVNADMADEGNSDYSLLAEESKFSDTYEPVSAAHTYSEVRKPVKKVNQLV